MAPLQPLLLTWASLVMLHCKALYALLLSFPFSLSLSL